jgi:hypothetical protein
MGPKYQETIDSYAASPQAAQSAGNQTLGKSIEQSPVHSGFGTGSSMYDNDMDKSYQPAPVAQPPQPQNQPLSAGITPSWAQQARSHGGRTARVEGGPVQLGMTSLANAGTQSPVLYGNAMAGMATPISAPATGNLDTSFQADLGRPDADTSFQADLGRPDAPIRSASSSNPFAAFGSMANQPPSMMMTGDTLASFAARRPQTTEPPPANMTDPVEAPISNSSSSYQNYLNNLYMQNLGRPAREEGLNYWTPLLQSGQITPQQLSGYIAQTQEYRQNLPTVLNEIYRQNVGRSPDEAGRQYWTPFLESGQITPQQLISTIRATPEGRSYAIDVSQGVVSDRPNTIDPFVQQYNARANAAQNLYGTIAQQNYAASERQRNEYQQALDTLNTSNEQALSEAQIAQQRQDEEAAAAARRAAEEHQRNLLLLIAMGAFR